MCGNLRSEANLSNRRYALPRLACATSVAQANGRGACRDRSSNSISAMPPPRFPFIGLYATIWRRPCSGASVPRAVVWRDAADNAGVIYRCS